MMDGNALIIVGVILLFFVALIAGLTNYETSEVKKENKNNTVTYLYNSTNVCGEAIIYLTEDFDCPDINFLVKKCKNFYYSLPEIEN